MSAVQSFHKIRSELKEISELKEGERLFISWKGSLSRFSSPENFLKKGPKWVQKIVTFVVKLFQAICRVMTAQNEGKSLKLFNSRLNSLEIPKKASLESLKDLKQVLENIKKVSSVYKKTIDSGVSWLRDPKRKDKESWIQEINQSSEKVSQLLTEVKSQIEKRDQETKESDIKTVKSFIKSPNIEIVSLRRSQRAFQKDRVIEGFKESFGEKSIHRVLKYYKLDQKEFLTSNELYAILVGCKAYMSSEDVEGLTSEQVYQKMIEMRGFEPLQESLKEEIYKGQLERDLEILKEMKAWNLYGEKEGNLSQYRPIEFLARQAIYGICFGVKEESQFPDKILVPGRDKRGHEICFETHLLSVKEGVMAACFVPFKREIDSVHVVFRGLNCLKSISRCFNLSDRQTGGVSEAVGEKTYKESEPIILERLSAYFREGIEVKIAGHSLGGVDAQRLMLSLARNTSCEGQKLSLYTFNSPGVNKRDGELYSEFYEKECSKVASETSVIPPITSGCEGGNRRSPLIGESNVKDLHKLEGPSGEFSENSPNVSVLTSSNLGVCDGEGIASKISESVSCRFKIRHFLVEGDILQDPGQVRLGVDVKNEKGVKAYIFNHGFEDEEETRWTHEIYYDAHCLPLSTYDKGREGRFKTTLNRVLKGKEAWKNLVTGLGQLTK